MNPEIAKETATTDRGEKPLEKVDESMSVDNLRLDDINISPAGEPAGGASADAAGSASSADDAAGAGASSDTAGDTAAAAEKKTESGEPDGSKEDDPDTKRQPDAGGTATGDPAQTIAGQASQQQEADADQEVLYNELSEETGVPIASDDDIVSSLKELAVFRSKGEDLSSLSEAIKSAIEVEKSGGSLAEHFSRVGMDFDKMDDHEVLRQKFFKDNAKLHKTNSKFAQRKFEKEHEGKYGKWVQYQNLATQEEKDDFVEEHGKDNIDYEKMMFENDAVEAKEELTTWKKQAAPIAANANGMTEEELTDYTAKYSAKADKAFTEFKSVSINMGEGKKEFALGLNEKTEPLVRQWITDPAVFLEDIGFKGKEIDTGIVLPIMTLIAEASEGTLGTRIAKFATDSADADTLENKIDKPGSTAKPVAGDAGEKDDWDLIGDAAVEAQERQDRQD